MKDKVEKPDLKESGPEELTIKSSRVSFLGNYLIAMLTIIFLILAWSIFNWKFTLLPRHQSEFLSTLGILCIAAVAGAFIEQPEWIRFMRTYVVTRDEVIETEGILSKRRIILPYQSISEVTVKKSLFGRILNYGDVFIGAFRTGSDINMKGIKNAHKIHEMIQNRINLLRKGQLEFWEVAKTKKTPPED